MPASYPSSAKAFTTKSDGAGNTILAAHVNDLQLEVTAIETDLLAGLPLGRGGTGLTALAANRVPYSTGSALTSAAGLTFDGTTLTAPATTITATLTAQALVDVSGAAAGQIKFPAAQNGSADANTLDDYEEGTWTPAAVGVTLTVNSARYTKIGRMVHVTADVTWPANADATQARFNGLPFAAGVDSAATVGFNGSANLAEGLIQTSAVLFYAAPNNGGTTRTNANFSGATIKVSGTYTV